MSNLSYVLIADASSEPDLTVCSEFAEQRWPALLLKDLSSVNVAQLYCAVTGQQYDSDLPLSIEMIGGNREEGRKVFAIPAQMRDALAEVPIEHIAGCASRLAETWNKPVEAAPERSPWRWNSVESVEWLIGELSAHARRAIEGGKSLYLLVDLWTRSVCPGEGWTTAPSASRGLATV